MGADISKENTVLRYRERESVLLGDIALPNIFLAVIAVNIQGRVFRVLQKKHKFLTKADLQVPGKAAVVFFEGAGEN